MSDTRICRVCGVEQPLDNFEIDSRVKGRRTNRCRPCKFSSQDKAVRAYNHLRERAAKLNIEVEATVEDVKNLYAMFDGLCLYCGEKETEEGPTWHLDHVRPLSDGGTNHISNLVIACPTCNLRKNKKPVISHLFDDERFNREHLSVLIHYIALTSGQPPQEILDDLVHDHAGYVYKRI